MPDSFYPGSPAEMASRETLLSIPGLEFLQRVADGRLPQAPIARAMNIRLVAAAPGEATFRGTPLFDHLNPSAAVHGGWYGTLLDSCMGCAVMTAMAPGQVCTTLEYKVNLVRAIPEGREVEARGRLAHSGRSTAVATGEIRDAVTGRLYATGSTTCLVMTPD
ncbi:MAG: PaaI family thioesterase [Roseicyclus sp.]